ncbi:hypothetical protein NQ317_003073 [Molorchus minor]|uniref:Uncharacterized protein n=1 Tax=Molorchus minor TaxID=1323400 RepID=A0ABQ9JP90_9CUCU|nr:hypothetical protein NQ317_003073 [Molorchus minor]
MYQWKNTSSSKVPNNAFRGGTDVDGSPLYVCRIQHAGDILPGSADPTKKTARASHAGRAHVKDKCQILCLDTACFEWVPSTDGEVLPEMIEGGKTNLGENLYVGRVYHKASHVIGKIHPSHRVCYIPFNDQEVMYQRYEALTLKRL